MNKHVNFEDNLFILNVRIRMIRDLLRLDADPGMFLEKTVNDLEFIDTVLESLTENLIGNTRLFDRELEFDNLSDIEWQFSQILSEFTNESNPFIAAMGGYPPPEARKSIYRLREHSAVRQKAVGETAGSPEQGHAEPVVSSLELSELLRER